MKVQSMKKLPEEQLLAAAVRNGSKIPLLGIMGIAAVNIAELTAQHQQHSSYLRSANDPKYGGSGPPPTDLDMLRYQAWLRAMSTVPDGMACYMTDPNPHPKYGPRWVDWAGARAEYRRRTINSEKQKGHEKPRDDLIVRTRKRDDALVYTIEFFARIHRWRMENLYHQGHYLPLRAATKAPRPDTRTSEPEVTVTDTPEVHSQASTGVPCNHHAYDEVQVQWHLYQAHLERMAKRQNQGEINAPWIFGMMQLHPLGTGEKYNLHRRITVSIKPEKEDRYLELCQKLYDLEASKQLDMEDEQANTLPQEKESKGSWWAMHMPAMTYLHEHPAEQETDTGTEGAATQETAMSPVEEPPPQAKGPESYPEYHDTTDYGMHLKAMAECRATNPLHLVWLQWVYQGRYAKSWSNVFIEDSLDWAIEVKAKRQYKAHLLRYQRNYKRKMEQLDSSPPNKGVIEETPSERVAKYNRSSSEALVFAGTSTMDLRKKQQEVTDYLHAVGGLSAFKQSDSGILVPSTADDFDDDVPW